MIDFTKPIREMDPAEMDKACQLAGGTLAVYKSKGVPADHIAMSSLVNLTGIFIADLHLDEETFLARCKEQFRLYLQFQMDQIEEKTGKMKEQ